VLQEIDSVLGSRFEPNVDDIPKLVSVIATIDHRSEALEPVNHEHEPQGHAIGRLPTQQHSPCKRGRF
jgi:hypothetical protein